jgi:hypothetical protein
MPTCRMIGGLEKDPYHKQQKLIVWKTLLRQLQVRSILFGQIRFMVPTVGNPTVDRLGAGMFENYSLMSVVMQCSVEIRCRVDMDD